MSEFEEARKHLLSYLDGFRKNIERAIDLKGDWKIEKPSLHTISSMPPQMTGGHHARYTLTVDLIESQFIEYSEDDEK